LVLPYHERRRGAVVAKRRRRGTLGRLLVVEARLLVVEARLLLPLVGLERLRA